MDEQDYMTNLSNVRAGKMPARNHEDIEEEDVWAMMEGGHSKSKSKHMNYNVIGNNSSAWRNFSTTPRITIPKSSAPVSVTGGSSGNSSAPVDIPDWNKILKKKSNKINLWDDSCNYTSHDDDDGHGHDGNSFNVDQINNNNKFDDVASDDVEGDEDEWVPPHEYLARRLASTRIASYSMCEGVGRTLKGRDLSKLRNAILTKTGFLEKN